MTPYRDRLNAGYYQPKQTAADKPTTENTASETAKTSAKKTTSK